MTVRHPGSSRVWDPEAGQMVHTPLPAHYDGPARIQALAGARNVEAAGEELHVGRYLVCLHVDAAPAPGDVVTITSCGTDPTLIGRVMRVDDVVRGSHRFERDLLCTLLEDT